MENEIGVKANLEVIKQEEIPHLLGEGEVGAVVQWIVRDKDGNITQQGQKKSESFVRQFLECLFMHMESTFWMVSNPIKTTGNVDSYPNPTLYTFYVGAGVGADTWGILIGTGNTAPTINDYSLQSKIAHATMNHGAVTWGLPASDASTSQFTITRDFSNVSGGAVTVNEIGLVGYTTRTESYSWLHLLIRDVIAGGISVPNGQTLTANYRIQATI